MVVVQRVRVRWGADARGSVRADARRDVAEAYPLPSLPRGAQLAVHDILADDHRDYEPVAQLVEGAVDRGGVHVELVGCAAVVTTLRGQASYPIRRAPARLFTLAAGEVGRYRANFRFRGHGCCATEWHYESWTVSVVHGEPRSDVFLHSEPGREVDHRVHLYGGRQRRSAKSHPA